MGEVYEADCVDDGRVVAVKVLFPHMAEMNTVIERFRREALAAQKVSARHAPALIELGQDGDGTHFIVMERLRGEDLATLLRRAGHLSPVELEPIVEGVTAALEVAHAAGIVHRDLKPQNVFVTATGEVRLLDFGIARLRDGTVTETLTAEAQVLGTPGFMAPEQARGAAAELGPHTDVFALAAICYRALTGKSAFPARTAAEAIYEALNRHPEPPSSLRPEIPKPLDAVITIGLSKTVADRYASARAFAIDFALAAHGHLPAQVVERAAGMLVTPDPFRVTEGFGDRHR
jgi:serine/threonine-protein kinase